MLYQCHIKESTGKERVMTVGLDSMTYPGVWTAIIMDSLSVTIITTLIYLPHHPLIE